MGDLSAAGNAISTVKELSPDNTAIQPEVQKLEVVRRFEEEGNKAFQKQDYRKVINCNKAIHLHSQNVYLPAIQFFYHVNFPTISVVLVPAKYV